MVTSEDKYNPLALIGDDLIVIKTGSAIMLKVWLVGCLWKAYNGQNFFDNEWLTITGRHI